jgi:hypothetical protein
MKVWQKIMVAPGCNIVPTSCVMSQRSESPEYSVGRALYRSFWQYQMAANSAHMISEVHSNVYRLFT